MQTNIPFLPEKKFPSKASMQPIFKFPKVTAVSNHFKVDFGTQGLAFIEWHMLITKRGTDEEMALDSRQGMDEVLRANRRSIIAKLGRHFASGSTLYTTQRTNLDTANFTEHQDYDITLKKKNDNTTVDVLSSRGERAQTLRFLDVSVKRLFADMKFVELGHNKKYYNPSQTQNVTSGDHKFIILKGFKTAFDIYEGGLRLLVDQSTRIIREYNLWEEVLYYRDRGMTDTDIAQTVICGHSMLTINGSQRIFRIDEVLPNARISDPFPNPEYKSFQDYYLKKYNIKLRYSDQFLLLHKHEIVNRNKKGQEISRREERVVLIPELVRATGLTDEMRADFQIMQAIGQHTILPPDRRFGAIEKIIDDMNTHKNKNPENSAGFTIDGKSNQVSGYQVPRPTIITGNNNSFIPDSDRLNLKSLAESRPFDQWVLVYEQSCEKNLDIVLNNFKKSSERFKVKFNQPNDIILLARKARGTDIESLIKANKKCKEPQMILFFVSRRNASFIYRDMKRHFNAIGIATQFFVSYNPKKDEMGLSKYTNLLLQMLTKLGDNMWYVDCNLKQALVLGADVYHARGNKSVASVVGQFGNYLKNTFSDVTVQPRAYQEIMQSISEMVLKNVEFYEKKNNAPPKTIMFYRDGVGEGQLEAVLNLEVKLLIEKLNDRYGPKRPELLFIIVTKRIDDRFASMQNGAKNPEGGLIIVDEIVKDGRANFFMVAQRVTQGTANATHYDIVYNETDYTLPHIIQVTSQLTWGYSNWMGPVKVPAPVQFAHKLCGLIGVTQDATVASKLKSVRYYL